MAKNNNYQDLMCLDIFLMYEGKLIIKDTLKESLDNTKFSPHPLMSWDMSGKAPCSVIDFWNIKEDILSLHNFSKKHDWNVDVQKILSLQYQALILTDSLQQISWVNTGFTEMTGYPADEAIGKTPRFLQGKNTSTAVKESISNALHKSRPFTKKVLNYRKNREEYICQLTIFPLLNKTNEITHFLALEVELEY